MKIYKKHLESEGSKWLLGYHPKRSSLHFQSFPRKPLAVGQFLGFKDSEHMIDNSGVRVIIRGEFESKTVL